MSEHPLQPCVLPYEDVAPAIAESAWLAPGVVVIGDVTLAEDVSVWYGSILRADVNRIRVGARSNIQDGSVLHVTRDRYATEVGEDVTIGHRAVVHGCRVEDGALIGIGAIVLDGARVGEGAWVGAGSVVPPGVRIPSNVLALGAPARVVRKLEADEIESQRSRTQLYIDLSRRHASSIG